ncbi:MAG: DUF2207 domain-containing protein, partial [Candidatus Bipolaricaulota bacterium]|nr:DUF2207 domain-containing protein [Candidatus Bipolaricaulota bacterium]
MRRLLPLALLVLSLWASAQTIEDFLVVLELRADASLEVTERIAVRFDLPRRGILREIPVSYRLPTGERYRLRLELLEVRQDGRPARYQTYG